MEYKIINFMSELFLVAFIIRPRIPLEVTICIRFILYTTLYLQSIKKRCYFISSAVRNCNTSCYIFSLFYCNSDSLGKISAVLQNGIKYFCFEKTFKNNHFFQTLRPMYGWKISTEQSNFSAV